MIISAVCSAEESCLTKKSITNQKFNINSKSYKFISYFCENKNSDEDDFFFGVRNTRSTCKKFQ